MDEMAVEAARAWLGRFLEAWNAGDDERVRAELHYPHVTIGPAGGQVVVASTPAEFSGNFEALRASEGWASSSFDDFTPISASASKVHFETTFARYRADGTRYRAGRVLYIVTEQDGHWGMQLRSGLPAPVA
ncbi:MAG: hypothetical protein R3C39_14100 [Dehalococcoidia bacterium]